MKAKKNSAKKITAKNIDPVVHFEFPAEDRNRISKFYRSAFGWKTQMLGEENGNYVIATTANETDKKGRPKRAGIINGGFYEKDPQKPAQYPSVVIAVDSLKRSMAKIAKAGGKILGEPMEVPGFGMYVSFFDTEGNRVAMMEPTMEMKEKAKNS
jgi:predicted enzyme related to lactoylglutathione lyase